MTTTNPLLKATRAALTELTTSEAQEWYRTTARATAAGAMAIAHRGIATVGHLLKPKPELLTGGEAVVPAVAAEPSPLIPFGWAAIEADKVVIVPVLRGGQSIISLEKSEDKAITMMAVGVEDELSEED